MYDLTEEQIKTIQDRCNEIINAFEPNDIYGEADTMYVVSHYNIQYPTETIGGDMYEYIMSYPLSNEEI